MKIPPPIREQIERCRVLEFLTLEQCCLLTGVSLSTGRRRLRDVPLDAADVLRNGRIVRVRRVAVLRLFRGI